MTDNAFKARDIGLRAQKKILSRMATKSIAKTFIDGTTASLLDNVYRLAKIHVSFNYYFYFGVQRFCKRKFIMSSLNCLNFNSVNLFN